VQTERGPEPVEHRRRWFDLALGIFIGLVLGIAVISAFVFLGSEESVDAPRISGAQSGKQAPAKVKAAARQAERP
jgi:hypothetical protein